MRLQTTAFRAHDPRWSFAPLSGEGAAIRGGRFNPQGFPALYLSLDPSTAIREANQGLMHRLEPCVLCSYSVDVEDVVNLADDAGRQIAGVDKETMAASWLSYTFTDHAPPQWKLVEELIAKGAAGALVPSYAPGATQADINLVLWRWGPDLPHKVEVFDPSGRLPKNQLSWEP